MVCTGLPGGRVVESCFNFYYGPAVSNCVCRPGPSNTNTNDDVDDVYRTNVMAMLCLSHQAYIVLASSKREVDASSYMYTKRGQILKIHFTQLAFIYSRFFGSFLIFLSLPK